ncbi:hypothetical protein LXA43DRAFT_930294, partial [Ganoderma leucocontextum]
MTSPVHRLPLELVRRIGDQLVGIKQWAADTPPPAQTTQFAPPARTQVVDFIGLRTLPSLATASRFFLEPALDALWDTLPDYGILVYLLPRDAWAVETVDPPGPGRVFPDDERRPRFQYVSITRALTEDEFKRVEYYTPRVRRIQERCPLFPNRFQGFVTYESSVLAAFAPRWTSATPLFPNLRVLDLSPANDQYPVYYQFFHVLFGSQLQRISNDCTTFSRMAKDVPPADYQQMVARLQESTPHLFHLKLYADVPPYSPIIVTAISTALSSFTHLVSARTGALPISEQAFRHLAELPHLEAIDVRLLDTMAESSFRRTIFDQFFPSLRELRLAHHFNLDLISLMVQRVHSPRLEIIGASLLDENLLVPPDNVTSFFSAVLSGNSSERMNLKELCIQASIERTPEGTFNERHLEPLFALKSLAHLRLHLGCTFDLDDAVLGRAARAWPNIRVLELGPDSFQKDTRVTLAALVPFAQHCPELQTLGFTLDADLFRVPPALRDSRAGVGCVQRELKVLNVGRARIADPQGVASFLVDLFPRL